MPIYFYPLGPAGQALNEELVYSLRSIYRIDAAARFVFSGQMPVGIDPSAYVGLPGGFSGLPPRQDSRRNIERFVLDDRCPSRFVMMHDDIVLLGYHPLVLEHRGWLSEDLARRSRDYPGAYTEMHANTLELLRDRGFAEPLCFALHRPLWVEREIMLEALEWTIDLDVSLRTVYGNLAAKRCPIPTVRVGDVKVRTALEAPDWTQRCISTSEEAWAGFAGEQIRREFAAAAPWEIPLPERYAKRMRRRCRSRVGVIQSS